jgi:uncharacterized membrane protein YkvA (DUF1232 family)
MEMKNMLIRIKNWAKHLKRQVYVLFFAYKDSRTPLFAKIFTACVVAYAFSPVDLIPDFIPILGYLDDLILIPFGIYFALKLIPKQVLEECNLKALTLLNKEKPQNWIAGTLIIVFWISAAIWLVVWFV